ncbi:MAG: YciI family protein [Caulobacteraceae bacterium]
MPMFVVICTDKPNSIDLRLATRPKHLEYVGGPGSPAKLGGPLLDDAGQPIGSLSIMEAEDRTAIEAFVADDPYALAGLFATVEIKPWRIAIGGIA